MMDILSTGGKMLFFLPEIEPEIEDQWTKRVEYPVSNKVS